MMWWIQEVFQHLGVPVSDVIYPKRLSRMYLMQHVPSSVLRKHGVNYDKFDITQTFLNTGDDVVLEKRGRAGAWSYQLTRGYHNPNQPQDNVLRSERVSRKQYTELLANADPECRPVEKSRTVFVAGSDSITYMLEQYNFGNDSGLEMLVVHEDSHMGEMPAFLNPYVIQQLVNPEERAAYTLSSLAKHTP